MRGYSEERSAAIEWPTFALVVACTIIWAGSVWMIGVNEAWWALPLLALPIALHSSLQHEIIHGHPTPWQSVNMLLVFPAVGLFLPFHRFREIHVRHHETADLGDPHDDPESPYFDAAEWSHMRAVLRALLKFHNTLAGRLLIGPPVSLFRLVGGDAGRIRSGDLQIAGHWLLHMPALLPVVAWLTYSGVPIWLYALIAAWPGMSILMLRTFAEHRWHPEIAGRSVTIERGGIFALLFLNNHLHAAHHHSPGLAWYKLPALSSALDRSGRIGGERFGSYGDIARRWLFSVRRPLIHPRGRPVE